MSNLRLRSVRIKDTARFADGLTNALTGMGQQRDPRVANAYVPSLFDPMQIAAAYSGSGLMRKIVNIPALDMVREWRDWQADGDDIARIEAEEKRHSLRQKVRQAENWRGTGGSVLIMGLPGDPSEPAPVQIGAGQFGYLHVVDRRSITFVDLQDDPTLPGYGEPTQWRMSTAKGPVVLHPSRVIAFRGDPPPAAMAGAYESRFWGECRVQQVLDAVQDCDSARQSFAHLLQKARHVRIGIPGLLNIVGNDDGEQLFQRRMLAFGMAESIFNATVYDAGSDGVGETVTDATYNFAGAKDIIAAFCMFASAVSDIPQSRLFGTAPEGMNSSGSSQQRDWNKMVRARQELDLAPCLDRLDAYLVQSATGRADSAIWYKWAPLDQETEGEAAARFDKLMDAATKLQNTATIPDVAFTKGVQSLMIDEGFMPGLDAALAEIPDDERYGELPVDDLPVTIGDAAPRTLYVSRPVLNRDDLQAWATAQGIGELQPDLHVTVIYSRAPIDWMKVEGEDWNQERDGTVEVPPGGVRIVEPLGDRTAVLLFTSSRLAWRHQQLLNAGAVSDFPDYQPHISLTGEPIDLSKIEPYRGAIQLGPEKFEEVRENV